MERKMFGWKLRQTVSVLFCFTISLFVSVAQASLFWDDFYVNYGDSLVNYPGSPPGSIVQLGLDNTTGSGFRSKFPYLYGRVSMKIKLVGGNSAGTVTSYYLASVFKYWGELDFEFLGNKTGQPYILQTNVFVEGKGEREQRMYLWFDPTIDYHEYGILWNQDLVLFLVDDVVIRVFKNSKDLGVPYLDYQPMYVYSSIWNGESWATRGGQDKTDWSRAPFLASYRDFDVGKACAVRSSGWDAINACYGALYRSGYGTPDSRVLTSKQIQDLRWVRQNYVIYDYCTDYGRFSRVPAECGRNRP